MKMNENFLCGEIYTKYLVQTEKGPDVRELCVSAFVIGTIALRLTQYCTSSFFSTVLNLNSQIEVCFESTLQLQRTKLFETESTV